MNAPTADPKAKSPATRLQLLRGSLQRYPTTSNTRWVQARRFAAAMKSAERPTSRPLVAPGRSATRQPDKSPKFQEPPADPSPSSDDPRGLPAMPPDEHAGDTMDDTINNLRARIAELEAEAHYMRDLHILAPCVTSYYTLVFRNMRIDYCNRGLPFPYSSWVDLFTAATNETTRFDNFDDDQKRLTDDIARVMKEMGGVTMEHWAELQELRRIRNELSHPRLNDARVHRVISARWMRHSAGDALKLITAYLATRGGVVHRNNGNRYNNNHYKRPTSASFRRYPRAANGGNISGSKQTKPKKCQPSTPSTGWPGDRRCSPASGVT